MSPHDHPLGRPISAHRWLSPVSRNAQGWRDTPSVIRCFKGRQSPFGLDKGRHLQLLLLITLYLLLSYKYTVQKLANN